MYKSRPEPVTFMSHPTKAMLFTHLLLGLKSVHFPRGFPTEPTCYMHVPSLPSWLHVCANNSHYFFYAK
jgi:hypothetical protein